MNTVEAKLTLLFRTDDDPDVIIARLRTMAQTNGMHCSHWKVRVVPEQRTPAPRRKGGK